MAGTRPGGAHHERRQTTMLDRVHNDFGESTALEVMDRLVSVAGLDIVDVGCGKGELARALVARGAIVTGIEPDDEQARANAALPPTPGLAFHQAGAQALPLAASSFDGVFFSKSLHHVPVEAMDRALGEATRVLRDEGFLYVLEPDIGGPFFELMRPFHDETEVRRAARAALARTASPAFREFRRLAFAVSRCYDGFDAFADEVLGLSYNRYRRADVEAADVRARFDAGWNGAAHCFQQPMTIFLFSGKTADG
jgi:ubiquinone/menaquinone biosynthesis C-methylase UbiE